MIIRGNDETRSIISIMRNWKNPNRAAGKYDRTMRQRESEGRKQNAL